MIHAEQKWTLLTVVFIGKVKTKWVKIKSYSRIRRRRKYIPIKLVGVINQEMKVIMSNGTENCPFTDGILGDTVQHTDHYISNLTSTAQVMPN
jgi:hypothetical protein